MPEPTAAADCRLVSVEHTVPLSRVEPGDVRRVARDWRKVWAFATADGLVHTARKVRSKLFESALRSDLFVILAAGARVGTETPVICLGTRHPRYAEVMLFHRDLIREVARLPTERLVRDACEATVRELGDDALAAVPGYDLNSPQRPPRECGLLLDGVTSHLARGAAADRRAALPGDRPARAGPSGNGGASRPLVAWWRPSLPRLERARPVAAVVVGAGDYTRAVAAPALRRAGARLDTVVDLDPLTAAFVRDGWGFARASTDWRGALEGATCELAVVASYHASHAAIASEALGRGMCVLLEKPPAVNAGDLALLTEAASRPGAFLEVGYNRRYAPFTQAAKQLLGGVSGPTVITCVVRELEIPPRHWYNWPNQGTRVAGNLCHWIDLVVFLLGGGCEPTEVAVVRGRDADRVLSMKFADGSLATVVATARGDASLGVQEWLQLRRAEVTVVIDDYRRITATRAGRTIYSRRRLRDKGHRAMYDAVLARIRRGDRASYTTRELELTTGLMLRAIELEESAARQSDVVAAHHGGRRYRER